ncbi:SDR family NAD(P)-dependent oxidoreductase [Pseudonocardia sp. ICBG601]|uniref:SDR family NAD(P)-dependent oxidoreductase n=1 Tax=Pseudonocardia sp. ICBG601 TaxID=2846759 RepID=UPI0021F5F648|nr:SDR family NAD(P)-dependent oxidoreductase [Pseudonocardia sp. ICBG601]
MVVVLDDLTTAAGCQTLVDQAVARFGGIDVLVNNVGGVRPRTEGFVEVTDADWQWALEVNLPLRRPRHAGGRAPPRAAGAVHDRHGLLGERVPAGPRA